MCVRVYIYIQMYTLSRIWGYTCVCQTGKTGKFPTFPQVRGRFWFGSAEIRKWRFATNVANLATLWASEAEIVTYATSCRSDDLTLCNPAHRVIRLLTRRQRKAPQVR